MNSKTLLIQDNDLVFDESMNFIMIEGSLEEAQSIERALTTNINEWFLNEGHGFDYNYIFTRNFDEERARLEVINTICQDPRVETVEKIEFEHIDGPEGERLLKIDFIAKMQGIQDPIKLHMKLGYVEPVVDFEDRIEPIWDHSSLDSPIIVQNDLGFLVDNVHQVIDYGLIPPAPPEAEGIENYDVKIIA